jgi:hypothetical protein
MPPIGQDRPQDSFEARETRLGCLAKTRTGDSPRPIAGHVTAKPRHPNAAFGDRPGTGLRKQGVESCEQVSSGVEPITGSGASVMRYWTLRLGREAPPCILSRDDD